MLKGTTWSAGEGGRGLSPTAVIYIMLTCIHYVKLDFTIKAVYTLVALVVFFFFTCSIDHLSVFNTVQYVDTTFCLNLSMNDSNVFSKLKCSVCCS